MVRILACSGGSVGHLAPLIAVSHALTACSPTVDVSFACSTGEQDVTYLSHEQLPFSAFPPLRRSPLLLLDTLHSLQKSISLLSTLIPDVVFGKGGSVSLPLCLAAWWRGIPIVIHESDVVMGRANRFLSRFADVVCIGFPQVKHSIVTGNPIRPEILQGSREEGLHITGFSGKRPVLLVIGGSQGAQAINEVITTLLLELTKLCDIIHITGPGKGTPTPPSAMSSPRRRALGVETGPNDYPLPPTTSYWSADYVHDELPHLYAAATLAVSRAGASTIAELSAWGIPTILVPLRGLAQDHQEANAQFFAERGAAVIIEQEHLLRELLPVLRDLLLSPQKQETLQQNILSLAMPNAARHIAEILLSVAKEKERA